MPQTFVVNLPTTSSADFDSSADSSSTSAADTPRTWWFAESANGQARYERFDETLVYLRDILEKQGPFDGVWGFRCAWLGCFNSTGVGADLPVDVGLTSQPRGRDGSLFNPAG